MGSPPPLFEFRHVTLDVGGVSVLDDVNCVIPDLPGTITVVAGPSGAGKSTLLRLCNRLEVPTRGQVFYRGDDVTDLDPLSLRRRVGMVFQRPTLFPGTIGDNLLVAYPGLAEVDAAEALRRVRLEPAFLAREVDTLSGGEAQRACLARTLVTGPEVVLMDEPTSSVDDEAKRALEGLAGELARNGVAIVWVTHDVEQLRRLAAHVVMLERGRVVRTG